MSEEESFKKSNSRNDNSKLGRTMTGNDLQLRLLVLFSEQNIKPPKSSCWFRDTNIVERPNLLIIHQSMPTGEQPK